MVLHIVVDHKNDSAKTDNAAKLKNDNCHLEEVLFNEVYAICYKALL